MKKPVQKILISLVLGALISQLVFLFAYRGLVRYSNHSMEKFTELFVNHSPHDLLFVGSSSVHQFINPRIIDSICGTNSYNAGTEGANLLEIHMILSAYLSTHEAPKTLLLTLDLSSFDLSKKLYNHIAYFPFLKNKVIYQTLSRCGHHTLMIQLAPFTQFIDYDDYYLSNCMKGYLGGQEIPAGSFQYKGYLSNTVKGLEQKDTTSFYRPVLIDPEGVRFLEEIIHTCQKKNIHLILTSAPEFNRIYQRHILNSSDVFECITKEAKQHGIPFLREDTLEVWKDRKLFTNTEHLDAGGAVVYSNILGKQLLPEVK